MRVAGRVEDRRPDPREVVAVPGRPYHRGHVRRGEVDLAQDVGKLPDLRRTRPDLLRGRCRRVDPPLGDVPLELLDDPIAELVREAHLGVQIAVELRPLALAVDEPPEKTDPAPVEVVEADGVAPVPAGEVGIAAEPVLRAVEHAGRAVEVAHVALPFDAVAAPVAPREAPRPAHAEKHFPARLVELLRDLAPGLSGADDHHRAGRQHPRVLVVVRGELREASRQARGHGRDVRVLVRAGGDDHVAGPERPFARRDLEAVARGPDRPRLDPAPDRRVEGARPRLEVAHERVAGEEPVRVVARVLRPGERDRPVRGDGAEGVPAVLAPARRDARALEHHVLDAGPGKEEADREAPLPGADDEGVVDAPRRARSGRHLPATRRR